MEYLKKLHTSQLLALVTANMAAQSGIIGRFPNALIKLAAFRKDLKAIQQEIFTRYNAG